MISKIYGRIFIPQDYGINYAKSPQVIVYDDFVRFYFSYCISDKGKLKSRIGYVDYTKDFLHVLDFSTEVIEDGALGTFDEHGIFPFSPFRDGKIIYAMTSGWSRRKSVSVETGIGLVISDDDGKTFNRIGDGPVMTASLDEPFLIVDGFIVNLGEKNYRMFYIYGTDWVYYDNSTQPERTYKIGCAESHNLINWKRYGKQLLKDKFEYESQALPSVMIIDGIWHMFFCYRHSNDFRENYKNSYKIGYAYSLDGSYWIRNDDFISIPVEDWCMEMQCYPNIFCCDDKYYLTYNGNKFGYNGFGLVEVNLFK